MGENAVLTADARTDMQSNRHIFFRWTPRTARVTIMYAVVVPAIIGYIGYKTDVSHPFPRPPRRAARANI